MLFLDYLLVILQLFLQLQHVGSGSSHVVIVAIAVAVVLSRRGSVVLPLLRCIAVAVLCRAAVVLLRP